MVTVESRERARERERRERAKLGAPNERVLGEVGRLFHHFLLGALGRNKFDLVWLFILSFRSLIVGESVCLVPTKRKPSKGMDEGPWSR